MIWFDWRLIHWRAPRQLAMWSRMLVDPITSVPHARQHQTIWNEIYILNQAFCGNFVDFYQNYSGPAPCHVIQVLYFIESRLKIFCFCQTFCFLLTRGGQSFIFQPPWLEPLSGFSLGCFPDIFRTIFNFFWAIYEFDQLFEFFQTVWVSKLSMNVRLNKQLFDISI